MLNSDEFKEAALEAAHSAWSATWADYYEENGGSLSQVEITDVAPRLDDEIQLPIIFRMIGKIENAWGFSIPILFHHMEINNVKEAGDALFSLIMGCLGHGISLADEYDHIFDEACIKLTGELKKISPVYLNSDEWIDIVDDYV